MTVSNGCNLGGFGVVGSAPTVIEGLYLGGSGRAALVLEPLQDATTYTPAAQLTADLEVGDVEDAHHVAPAEAQSGAVDAVALSSQENWGAGRLNPFSNLWDLLTSVRDWFAGLMPVATLESAWALSGAEASALSMPTSLQMALTDPTVGKPVEATSMPSPMSGQGAGPAKVKAQKPLPAWLRYYRPAPNR